MTAVEIPPDTPTTSAGNEHDDVWYNAMAGVIVAAGGLLVLLGIIAFALFTLPDSPSKGQNVVALATSGFGVIGAIVGAFFGVRAANRAVDKAHKQNR